MTAIMTDDNQMLLAKTLNLNAVKKTLHLDLFKDLVREFVNVNLVCKITDSIQLYIAQYVFSMYWTIILCVLDKVLSYNTFLVVWIFQHWSRIIHGLDYHQRNDHADVRQMRYGRVKIVKSIPEFKTRLQICR